MTFPAARWGWAARPRARLSLRRRLAVIAALAVALAIALASATAFLTSRATLLGQLDATLQSQARVLASSNGMNLNQPQTQLFALVPALQIITGSGQRSIPSYQRVYLPVDRAELAVAAGRRGEELRTVTVAGQRLRMITVPYRVPGLPPLALQLTRPLADVDTALRRLAVLLWLVTAGGALVAVTVGLGVASAGLAPVTELARDIDGAARTGDLRARLPVLGSDEVGRLATSFNTLLAALERSRDRQRRLVADAGHELRTPLTSLRTNVELLVRAHQQDRPLAAEDQLRLLTDLTGQTEELAALVGELTTLARDDLPEEPVEELDLAEVVTRAVVRARRRAVAVTIEEREIAPTPIAGRRVLLERAVLNVLDNAVKWSPAGGIVTVALQDATLVITDQGPGIPPEDLPHVFERFYRSDTSRGMPGSGLGLAIVAEVAQQHGAAASLERGSGGGTIARLVFPTAASAQAPQRVQPAPRDGSAAAAAVPDASSPESGRHVSEPSSGAR